MDKKALRAEIKAKKRAMTEEQIAATSEALAQQLYNHPAYREANPVHLPRRAALHRKYLAKVLLRRSAKHSMKISEALTLTSDESDNVTLSGVTYGKLTITKKIQDANGDALSANPGETFVFNVIKPDGKTMQVVISGTDSVTLTNLPLGSYTVTEDESWSYKYTSLYASVEVSVTENSDAYAKIINVPKKDKWLKADAYEENVFNAVN